MNNPLNGVFFDPARRTTPVTEAATPDQVENNTGGFVFQIDDMERARRFLILGSDKSFYQPGAQLSMQNAEVIQRIAKSDRAIELIELIKGISITGRAPKQSPGLFALAVVISQTEDAKVKSYGYSQLSAIARTASALFEFTNYLSQFQQLGGMGFQKAIGRWYNEKPVDKLAYQMVKYRQRNGFDHSRLLRLSKRVKSVDRPEISALLDWALGKGNHDDFIDGKYPRIVEGFELAKAADAKDIPGLIKTYGLTWEMIPTEHLNHYKVWDAFLDADTLPLGALIRQLPRLTNLGIINQLGGRTREIEDILRDPEQIKRARIHPLKALVAMRTYANGHGERQSWVPAPRIVDALEDTFYTAFDFVEPTNKRWMLNIDVSGSMGFNKIAGLPITPAEASACMAMVTARTERDHAIAGFAARSDGYWNRGSELVNLNITPKTRLQDAMRNTQMANFGATDLSLPMEYAIAHRLPVDAFVIYTDNEVNVGRRHPFQALSEYRRVMGISAKMIVVGMTATPFSIANPSDAGMMDIAGFDTAAPGLMADFVR